jgi:alginate O-acetyltransferase complex protein AlgI
MALGSAHALGFKLPVNFRQPYLAENIAELWRRWHITLSAWLRDYIYIPLGGSRGTRWRTARNLVATFALAGLWHGAGLHFIAFGIVQGVWLAVHRLVRWPDWTGHRWLRPARIAVTVGGFTLSLVVFRAPSLSQGWLMLTRMVAPAGGVVPTPGVQLLALTTLALLWLAHGLASRRAWRRATVSWPVGAVGLGLGFVLAQLLSPGTGGAFVYFQF